jgi:hypothetical protein
MRSSFASGFFLEGFAMDSSTFLSSCLSEPQRAAIGLVTAESAWLERGVEHFIQRLARLNRKNTDHLLDGRMMASKLELLKALGRARLKEEGARQEFSDVIAKVAADVLPVTRRS